MNKIGSVLLSTFLAVSGVSPAAAQEATTAQPKVLQITREWIKPYKNGMAHDKSEGAFVAAMAKAKFPVHYVALNSMTGRSRALYLTRYNSFEEWEQSNAIVDKNAALNAELERAGLADGELLEQTDSGVFLYDEDLSYRPRPDLSHARYLELTVFHVRPGHRKEWLEVVKKVKEGYDKAGTSAHWGMYEIAYGGNDGTFLALSSDNSMADIDKGFADNKKFMEAMGGEEGMNKLDELFGSAVESSGNELFSVNPKQSYVDEAWISANPGFWKPKATESSAAKPAAKPAAAAATAKPASR
jgi:hypothetical protein